jgi:hypothetical protein
VNRLEVIEQRLSDLDARTRTLEQKFDAVLTGLLHGTKPRKHGRDKKED